MTRIEFLEQQKERSRELFLKTRDKSHLADMHYFEERLRDEEKKPLERLEWVLVGLMLVTILAPFIQWLLFYR